ncbi:aspartate/glutamate racemase family protein [Planktotalea sp.]|uniref:aspartate/glutamate racemase family protein n=1 Tax=Planktotalea sp. TaxID=2029877 RepID=UPI0025D8C943|nr:aspartate/glutamate racemase family protein [Planktotalea sp.]
MTIIVINPNSNEAVTQGLRDALTPFPNVDCITLKEGPFGIESQRDSDSVILPMLDLIQTHPDASAFVIACYSDPGIDTAKSVCSVPVFGMQEAAVTTAMCRADMFGIIAIGEGSIRRHRKYMRRMGVLDRLAGERALNMSVDETARGANTYKRLTEVGAQLIEDGAQCLILGCAGMAKHRSPLEADLGVPVIDPTQAAVAMALGTVLASSF